MPIENSSPDSPSQAEKKNLERLSPFKMINWLFFGFAVSLTYGVAGALLIAGTAGIPEARKFFIAYTIDFSTIFSLGLSIGTAEIVFRFQDVIPDTIENAFRGQALPPSYSLYKERYRSRSKTVDMCAQFVIVAFVIFGGCQFPLPPVGEALMLIAASAEVGLGVYLARKLFYAGMMLHSLQDMTVKRNLFRRRELDEIDKFVHIASTLAVIFVYLHVTNYYSGPFEYKRIVGKSMQIFLLAPTVMAVPVLATFNFYAQIVLKKLYDQSIDITLRRLRKILRRQGLTDYERRSYLLEVDRMSREELRYSLHQAISDLPLGITLLVMLVQPFLNK